MCRVKFIREPKEPNDVYIGRGSKWGNPYRIGVHGSREGPYDTQWVDNLLLSSGALRSAAEVAADTTYYGPYCPGN